MKAYAFDSKTNRMLFRQYVRLKVRAVRKLLEDPYGQKILAGWLKEAFEARKYKDGRLAGTALKLKDLGSLFEQLLSDHVSPSVKKSLIKRIKRELREVNGVFIEIPFEVIRKAPPQVVGDKIMNDLMRLRELLVLGNLKLVYRIASKFNVYEQGLKEDLISAGMVGLLRAIDQFKPNNHTSFSTVATAWIRKEMLKERALQAEVAGVVVSKSKYHEYVKAVSFITNVYEERNECPDVNEVVKGARVSKTVAKQALEAVKEGRPMPQFVPVSSPEEADRFLYPS